MRLEARGKRIASSAPQRQTAEIHVRVALMNRFNARSTAVLERAA
ncbi:transposase [Ketogulonicigenium robustum]|uniref:Transposase n=2 Tax=Ketogulonicigenium robustum TaxID=92947 RepID=A0A1W6NZC4_9RHOB|nr:transposase [Ketogulonicigenium robustum]